MRLLSCLLITLLLALPARAAELKLATWNLAWLTLRPTGDPALPADVLARRSEDFDRLAGYARRLNADVVALQEIDGPEPAARVFDPRHYQLLFAEEEDVQRVGFAIHRSVRFERHPDLAELDLRPNGPHTLRRGVDVSIIGPGQRLRLLALHLVSFCHEQPLAPPQGSACTSLSRQVPLVAQWIAARQREGVAFAVLGDLNRRIRPGEEMWEAFNAAAPLLSVTEGFANPCWARPGGAGRPFIDHILLGGPARDWLRRDSLKVLVYAETDPRLRNAISDHCPVGVQLRLP